MKLGRVALLILLALAVLVAPLGADAQGKVYRISALVTDRLTEGRLVEGLKELGYVAGRNVVIDRRYVEGSQERLADLATELVASKPDVIFVNTGTNTAAVQQATTTIPIVAIGGDLLGQGLVASLARPGGNITGLQVQQPELAGKRLALLKEAMPSLSRVGLLLGTGSQQVHDLIVRETQSVAGPLGLTVHVLKAREPAALDTAFATFARERVGAVLIPSGSLMLQQRERLATLARRHGLPTMCDSRSYIEYGHPMSYGVDQRELYRRVATYIDRILKGAKPGDLPVEHATKFELVINLKTAKALGPHHPAVAAAAGGSGD